MSRELVVEADGGSRGNPGHAAGGAVVLDPQTGEVLVEVGIYVGIASNNVAEYHGMIAGVDAALQVDPAAHLRVRLDSKLLVEQMSGRWKIKHPDMARLAAEARRLLSGVPVDFEWIPRRSPGQRVDGHPGELPALTPAILGSANGPARRPRRPPRRAPRNVRAPQGRAVGNTHPEQSARKCNREQTAGYLGSR